MASCFSSIPILLVELIFFLFKTGESMLDATMRPHIISVVCNSRFYNNDSACQNLHRFPELEDDIENEAGTYLMYNRILVTFTPIFLALFFGSWSDKYGRKIPMVMPLIGNLLSLFFYMMSVKFPDFALGWILLGALYQGTFGNSPLFEMVVHSYATDISDIGDRTKTLGKLLAMYYFGLFAGSLLSGIFMDFVNLPAAFSMALFLHGAALLITICCLPETITPDTSTARDVDKHGSCFKRNVLDEFKKSISLELCKKCENGRKMYMVIALFLILCFHTVCKIGETDITLLFVMRSPLSWPKSWYGYLLSLDFALMGLCLLVILPILSNLMKLPDGAIVILGISCKIVRLFWAGFITESWMVYVSILFSSFGALITSSIRSLVSKTVEENEQGKVFSWLVSTETVCKLFGTVIFINLYEATASFFPGFAYIVGAFLYVLILLVMVFIYKDLKYSPVTTIEP